jgi:hypothetical protein
MALLKATVEKHPGVKLTIDVALPAIPLDVDIEGFDTIVVSYFTVSLNLLVSNIRTLRICTAILSDTYTALGGAFHELMQNPLIPCSIFTAHGPNEFVTKADLLEAVEGYKKLILRALN